MEKIKELIKGLDKTRKHYAVFDCDMTIISTDVERMCLKYQTENSEYRISLEEMKDKLRKYDKFKHEIENLNIERDFRSLVNKIYLEYGDDISSFLLKGYTKEEVYELTKTALNYYGYSDPRREYIKELFKLLRDNNILIYICSASILYEVYVAADMYNIPRENVLAIDNELDDEGRFKGIEKGYLTRQKGKVLAIKSLGYGYPPFLVAGDSDGDYNMLKEFDIEYGMIINPMKNTKVYKLIDNKKYFYHKIED